jgi:hypothetical protein
MHNFQLLFRSQRYPRAMPQPLPNNAGPTISSAPHRAGCRGPLDKDRRNPRAARYRRVGEGFREALALYPPSLRCDGAGVRGHVDHEDPARAEGVQGRAGAGLNAHTASAESACERMDLRETGDLVHLPAVRAHGFGEFHLQDGGQLPPWKRWLRIHCTGKTSSPRRPGRGIRSNPARFRSGE